MGARVIGAAPNYDVDHPGQIKRIFELAQRFDVDIDMHIDSGHDPASLDTHLVADLTERMKLGGRVTMGHMTKLAGLPPAHQKEIARRLANVGVAVTVLPSTDLFVLARHADHNVPRCVADANLFVDEGCIDLIEQHPEPIHAVRRWLADPHGQPACQYSADRKARAYGGAVRHDLGSLGTAHEPRRLRPKSRQSRRCRDHRCVHARDGGRHDCAGARRLQTRPPDGRSAERPALASGLSR